MVMYCSDTLQGGENARDDGKDVGQYKHAQQDHSRSCGGPEYGLPYFLIHDEAPLCFVVSVFYRRSGILIIPKCLENVNSGEKEPFFMHEVVWLQH